MDPVSVIVSSVALAAAAEAGKGVIGEFAKDAYERVKRLLKSRYPKASVEAVEHRPDSDKRRAVLAEDLKDAGAGGDSDLLELARTLIEAVQKRAPNTAQTIGIELENIRGENLLLSDVESSGPAVKVKGGRFKRNVEMKGIKAGVGAAPREMDTPGRTMTEATANDLEGLPPIIRIESTIGGSISISNVEVAVYRNQIQRLGRVRWRGLEPVSYAVPSDSAIARQTFIGAICVALRDTFGDSYEQFTVIAKMEERSGDSGVVVYRLASPRAKFAALVQQRQKKLVESAIAARGEAALAKIRQECLDQERREEERWAEWSFETGIEFSAQPSALEIIYDPETKRVRLETAHGYSLDPADYPDHLARTSELLKFIAASYRTHIAFVGDLSWQKDNYRLTKVMMRLLDRQPIDLAALRINVDDPEDWDYSNPSFESEIGSVLASAKHSW